MDSGKSWDVAEAQRPGIEKREGALLDPKRAKTFVSIEGVCVCVCVCVCGQQRTPEIRHVPFSSLCKWQVINHTSQV